LQDADDLFLSVALAFHQSILLPTYITGYSHYNWYRFRGRVIILDSFAGSGTTAHAVLDANNKDGGDRRFILVECEGYADTLTAERIRRVINGYAFSGTQREELYREKITWSAFSRKSHEILEQVITPSGL
jgi:hypothetical protein